MFLLKKIVAPFLFPVPIILLILGIGLLRLWRNHKQVAPKGRNWLTLGFILLVLLSMRPVPTFLLGELEDRYQNFDHTPDDGTAVAAVVVLAGGVSDDPDLDAFQRLSEASLARLTEGMRIARLFPDARFILSGGAVFSSVSEASMMAEVAKGLGFDSTRIELEEMSHDTDDQAKAMGGFSNGDPFVLVTSASHMPRAVRLFKNHGLDPIPAPTNRMVKHSTTLHPGGFFPSAIHLELSRIMIREGLGIAWASLVQWTKRN